MARAFGFLFCVVVVASATALVPPPNYTQTIEWFPGQQLDHFDMTNLAVWSQRYFLIKDYWNAPHGPVIFHLCGEYTCSGIWSPRLFPVELAQKHNALIVTLEHRFFGESQPFSNLSVSNLKFLNSRQAVNDLGFFAQWFQTKFINQPYTLPADTFNSWIPYGGSYPGALSSWYRLKFPALSVGAVSSSGVIHAILNFTAFDKQVATAAGPACADALRGATAGAEEDLASAKALLGAATLRDDDFLFLLADAAAEGVQYGHRDILCSYMMLPSAASAAAASPAQLLAAYANYTVNYFYKVMGNSAAGYDRTLMQSPTVSPLGGGRQWWWMKCTELAYFQVAPAVGSIRSSLVNLTWHQNMCYDLFGITRLPDVAATNNYYGGSHSYDTNTVFVNGGQDPWQWAGVTEVQPTAQKLLVKCDVCAHCCEMYTPTPNDPAPLKAARATVRTAIAQWLESSD